jgi:hypothetical protein
LLLFADLLIHRSLARRDLDRVAKEKLALVGGRCACRRLLGVLDGLGRSRHWMVWLRRTLRSASTRRESQHQKYAHHDLNVSV